MRIILPILFLCCLQAGRLPTARAADEGSITFANGDELPGVLGCLIADDEAPGSGDRLTDEVVHRDVAPIGIHEGFHVSNIRRPLAHLVTKFEQE